MLYTIIACLLGMALVLGTPAWGEQNLEAKVQALVANASGVYRSEWRTTPAPEVKGFEIREQEKEVSLQDLRGRVVLLNFFARG